MSELLSEVRAKLRNIPFHDLLLVSHALNAIGLLLSYIGAFTIDWYSEIVVANNVTTEFRDGLFYRCTRTLAPHPTTYWDCSKFKDLGLDESVTYKAGAVLAVGGIACWTAIWLVKFGRFLLALLCSKCRAPCGCFPNVLQLIAKIFAVIGGAIVLGIEVSNVTAKEIGAEHLYSGPIFFLGLLHGYYVDVLDWYMWCNSKKSHDHESMPINTPEDR